DLNLGPKDYESSALTAELMSQRNDENISETIALCQLLHTKIAKNMKKNPLAPRKYRVRLLQQSQS
ncbi:MAG: hypothetical protein IIU02_02365, partial [Treponema sp.]|uniref:hypothetical protein n=1 Tax=Treponema sp. TaxID=166 RepID=UPI00257BD36D